MKLNRRRKNLLFQEYSIEHVVCWFPESFGANLGACRCVSWLCMTDQTASISISTSVHISMHIFAAESLFISDKLCNGKVVAIQAMDRD